MEEFIEAVRAIDWLAIGTGGFTIVWVIRRVIEGWRNGSVQARDETAAMPASAEPSPYPSGTRIQGLINNQLQIMADVAAIRSGQERDHLLIIDLVASIRRIERDSEKDYEDRRWIKDSLRWLRSKVQKMRTLMESESERAPRRREQQEEALHDS